MNTTKPKGRKVAWVVLGVVGIAVAMTCYLSWDWIAYEHTERVYWPNGTIRYEYRVQRWGKEPASLYELNRWGKESTGRGGRGTKTSSTLREDGKWETFVFPGSHNEPDAIFDGPPTDDQLYDLMRKLGLPSPLHRPRPSPQSPPG